jgi:hypothetical protein
MLWLVLNVKDENYFSFLFFVGRPLIYARNQAPSGLNERTKQKITAA